MFGSPPPFLAAMMIARLSLLHSLPRLASMAPFLCLIVAQWECPDMGPPSRLLVGSPCATARVSSSPRPPSSGGEGLGVRGGFLPGQAQPPHPQPLSPEYRGEGRK